MLINYFTIPGILSINHTPDSIKIKRIMEYVLNYSQLTLTVLMSGVRKREYVDARQLFCFLARTYTKMSLATIGLEINKDHATVIHGCKKLQGRKSKGEVQATISIMNDLAESYSGITWSIRNQPDFDMVKIETFR